MEYLSSLPVYRKISVKQCVIILTLVKASVLYLTDAAGNFLCPAASLSFNAFKTVMEIDTMGTFNTSKVVYEKWFQVQYIFCLCDTRFPSFKLRSHK